MTSPPRPFEPSRRQWMGAAGASLLGTLGGAGTVSTKGALQQSSSSARAKSVIFIYLQGGPPTQDMFDLKPHAPDGVGGEFRPIATSVPGLQIGEHLLGIDPEMPVHERANRPVPIAHGGRPVREILA